MEPQIRYVRSADSTKIDTASLGSGTPVVMIPAALGNMEAYFSIPEVRAPVDFLAEKFRFITYDPRGRGLSDRDVSDWSLDARVSDLHAVFEGLSLPSSFLFARAWGSLVAIAFTARYPGLVNRLGLYAPMVRGTDARIGEARRAFEAVQEFDWTLYCKFLALTFFDWTESGRLFAEQFGKAFTPESSAASTQASLGDDIGEYLEQIACPTLVIQPKQPTQHSTFTSDAGREVAARIKDARFRMSGLTEWLSLLLTIDDARAFADFFEEENTGTGPQSKLPTGTALILFADIVDSTALTERLGDAAFRAKARDLDAALRTIIRDHGGTAIEGKLLGDGVLAVFTSACQAIEAALACAHVGNDAALPLHLGLHAGDVIREDNNLYGGAVNIASRISGLSAPGEVLVSDIVRGLARTSAGVAFEDRGEQALKGVGDAVRVWAVRERM